MFEEPVRRGRLVLHEGDDTNGTRGEAVDSEQADPGATEDRATGGTYAGRADSGHVDAVEAGGGDTTDGAGSVLADEERAERLRELNGLVDLMRPAVQADGGDLVLISADVTTGVVEVQLQGACSSCAVSASTLQGGVDRILRDRLPWITEVRGGVDESMDPFESESMGRGGYVPSF